MRSRVLGRKGVAGTGHHHYTTGDPSPLSVLSPPPLTTESPTTHYCTVQHHVPIDPYAERMPRADCSSNTIRDSITLGLKSRLKIQSPNRELSGSG